MDDLSPPPLHDRGIYVLGYYRSSLEKEIIHRPISPLNITMMENINMTRAWAEEFVMLAESIREMHKYPYRYSPDNLEHRCYKVDRFLHQFSEEILDYTNQYYVDLHRLNKLKAFCGTEEMSSVSIILIWRLGRLIPSLKSCTNLDMVAV